jgi:hypothetical protein
MMTGDLLALSDWLAEVGVTHVTMESTGEYWRPVDHLLEGTVAVLLVNAAHMKQVAGRKTDKADARWLAKLMRYGLLQASFIVGARTQQRSQPAPRGAEASQYQTGRGGDKHHGRLWTSHVGSADCWMSGPWDDGRVGKRRMRTGLTQIGHAAARTNGTYLSALYQRLAARRGKQWAVMAAAHAIVVSAFRRLSRHEPSRELGAHCCDAHRRDHLVDRLTRRMRH